MREAVFAGQPLGEEGRDPLFFSLLPGQCCQSAGGQADWANDLASGWYLFYTAAHLMDSVADQDEPELWWRELGPGAAINVASGLFFCAWRAFNRLYTQEKSFSVAPEIVEQFHQCFLTMCSGQHRDLIDSLPSLDAYWEIIGAKSGVFFALACWSGARLATDDKKRLEGYRHFGYQLGVVLQILDDLKDLQAYENQNVPHRWSTASRSLPFVYVLSVLPNPGRDRFLELLKLADVDLRAGSQVMQMLEDSGAALYLLTELERHRKLALETLDLIRPSARERKVLTAYLDLNLPNQNR